MKFWGAMILLLSAGCASARPVAVARAPEEVPEGREYVDRLRVDTSWRPVSMGGECVSCWYELPQGSYVAQGWPWYAYCRESRPYYSWRTHARPRPHCY